MLNAVSRSIEFDFAPMRAREFSRLDEQGMTYLDYTGSALYGSSQVRAHLAALERGIFGNPHSESEPSVASTRLIEEMKDLVLAHFGVDRSSHEICFTANTTAAIRLVAESFPFGPDAPLLISADNHNSVNGIREFARRRSSSVHVLPIDGSRGLRLVEPEQHIRALARPGGLLAFPAQSNFSGVLHPLELVEVARGEGLRVLLDCAAYVPSHPLDLRRCPADFAVLSFYKMFGYPTGLGALIARRRSLAMLERPWFAGGTVEYASVGADLHRLRSGSAGFEDGTPDFLSIGALRRGFEMLDEIGMPVIADRVDALTSRLVSGLIGLRQRNRAPLVELHGPGAGERRGCTVAFNVLDEHGRIVPYGAIEDRAQKQRIALRGGCFCNPGAAEAALGLGRETLLRAFAGAGEEFSVGRFAEAAGSAVGAIRVSAGLATSEGDVDRCIEFVAGLG